MTSTEKENPEPLLRSTSNNESFRILPCNFNLISVVRMILPSPASLTLEEVPQEYMEGITVWRADWDLTASVVLDP